MAKKDKHKLDSFDFDDGMDFDMDDDPAGPMIDKAVKSKSRSPVLDAVKGAAGGAVSHVTNPDNVKKYVLDALPESYTTIAGEAGKVKDTVLGLYDDAVRDVKPQLGRIVKKVDKLIPENQKSLKAVTSGMKNMLGITEESKYNSPTAQQVQDQSINAGIAQIFAQQQTQQQQNTLNETRDRAERRIETAVNNRQFKASYGAMASIDKNIASLESYNLGVNQAFQKKSLELQYRQFFATKDLLEETRKYFKIFEAQNTAITKNTALPEFSKIHMSERFHQESKQRFVKGALNSVFGDDTAIGSFLKREKAKAKQKIDDQVRALSEIGNSIEEITQALDQLDEQRKSFADMPGAGDSLPSTAEVLGSAGGDSIAGFLLRKVLPYARAWSHENRAVSEFGARVGNKMLNASGAARTYRESEAHQANLEKEGVMGMLAKVTDYVLTNLAESSPDMRYGNPNDDDLNKNAPIFNNRTQRSIVDIIPGYLSRIEREIKVMRTGDESIELTKYDLKTGKFMSKSKLSSTLNARVAGEVRSDLSYSTELAYQSLFGRRAYGDEEGDTNSREVKDEIRDAIAQLSTMQNVEWTPDNIRNTKIFADMSKEAQEALDQALTKKITDATRDKEAQYQLTSNMLNVRKSHGDIRPEVERLLRLGYGEELEQAGLVQRDEQGSYFTDKASYFKYQRQHGIKPSEEYNRPAPPASAAEILRIQGPRGDEGPTPSSAPEAPPDNRGPPGSGGGTFDVQAADRSPAIAAEAPVVSPPPITPAPGPLVPPPITPAPQPTGKKPVVVARRPNRKYFDPKWIRPLQDDDPSAYDGTRKITSSTWVKDKNGKMSIRRLSREERNALEQQEQARQYQAASQGRAVNPPAQGGVDTSNWPKVKVIEPHIDPKTGRWYDPFNPNMNPDLGRRDDGPYQVVVFEDGTTWSNVPGMPSITSPVQGAANEMLNQAQGQPGVRPGYTSIDEILRRGQANQQQPYNPAMAGQVPPGPGGLPGGWLPQGPPLKPGENPWMRGGVQWGYNIEDFQDKPTEFWPANKPRRLLKTMKSGYATPGQPPQAPAPQTPQGAADPNAPRPGYVSIDQILRRGQTGSAPVAAPQAAQQAAAASDPSNTPRPGYISADQLFRRQHPGVAQGGMPSYAPGIPVGTSINDIARGGSAGQPGVYQPSVTPVDPSMSWMAPPEAFGKSTLPGVEPLEDSEELRRAFRPFRDKDIDDTNTSDETVKQDIKSFKPKDALRKIRELPIFNWRYKPGEGDGSDKTRTGPMAQDVRDKVGDEVAPGGKKIDLLSMNGLTMAAIQELDDKMKSFLDGQKDKPEDTSEKKHGALMELLKMMAQDVSIIRNINVHAYAHVTGTEPTDAIKLTNIQGANGFQGNGYGSMFANLFGNASMIFGKGLNDTASAGLKAAGGVKDYIVKPGVGVLSKIYEKGKDPAKEGAKWVLQKGTELSIKALNFGSDVLFKHLPRFGGWLGKKMSQLKTKAEELLNGAKDVYIKGRAAPALQAVLMRAGEYRDSVSGKVITSMDDLKRLQGNVVNRAGETVLTLEDAAKGLFDQYGSKVTGLFSKVTGAAAGYALKGLVRGQAAIKSMLRSGKGLFGGLKEKIGTPEWMKKLQSGDFGGMGSDRIYEVLVEIRDIMIGKRGIPHEEKLNAKREERLKAEEAKKAQEQAKAEEDTKKSEDKIDEVTLRLAKMIGVSPEALLAEQNKPAAPSEAAVAARTPDAKNEAIKQQVGSIFDIFRQAFKPKDKAQTTEAGAEAAKEEPKKEEPTAEVAATLEDAKRILEKSTQEQNKPGLFGRASSYLKGKFKRKTKKKLVEGLGPGALAAELIAQEQQKAQEAKDKAAETPAQTPEAAAAQAEAQPKQKSLGRRIAVGALKTMAFGGFGLMGKAALGAGSAAGKLFSKKKEDLGPGALAAELIAQEKKEAKQQADKAAELKDKPAFNDRDGSGRRDGDAQDRLDKQAEADKENKKDFVKASTDPKYVGDGALGMLGGLFDFIKKGFSGFTGGILPMLGGLLKTVALGGFGTMGKVAKGISAVGRPLATVAGKVATSAPMLGRIATIGRIAMTVGMGVGGGLGGILGGLGAAVGVVGTVLTSPFVLGAAAIAVTAYGGYKLYKYLTRNSADEYDVIRLNQYGLTNTEADKNFNQYIFGLEKYLTDGRIKYEKGKADIITDKVEQKELFDLFKIDEKDQDGVRNFATWFGQRFRPFFLTHLTALYSIAPKAALDEVSKLTPQEKLKYLSLIGNESGPYNISTSPFKDLPELNTNPELAKNAISNLQNALAKEAKIDITKVKAQEVEDKAKKAAEKDTKDPQKAVAEDVKNLKQRIEDRENDDMFKKMKKAEGGEGDGKVKDNVTAPEDKSGKLNPGAGKVVMAGGPLVDGSAADSFIKPKSDVKLSGMNPELMENFKGMVQEYGDLTGKPVQVNSAARSTKEQEELYRRDPSKAAKPGSSLHEFGLAMDLNSATLDEMDKLGLMRKYGFTRPVGGEPWHMEPAGIQVGLKQAKNDPEWASKMIEESPGKGGGGAALVSQIPKGRRSMDLALSLIDAPASVKDFTTDKDKISNSLGGSQVPEKKEQTKPVTTAANDSSFKPKEAAPGPKQPSDNAPKMLTASAAISEGQKRSKSFAGPEVESPKLGAGPDPKKAGVSVDPSNKEQVKSAVEQIAKQQNEDPKMMSAFAAVESSLNPMAQSNASSAAGLFQFTSGTWKEQLAKAAAKNGLPPDASPMDVEASTIVATEYIKNNKRALKSVKDDVNITDMYLAHFLGTGGAKRFLSAKKDALGSDIFPDAAKSNPGIFTDNGRPLTIAEIYNKLTAKLSKTAKDFGINLPAQQSLSGGENNWTASISSGGGQSTASASSSAEPVRAFNVSKGRVSPGAASEPAMMQTSAPVRKASMAPAGPSVLGSGSYGPDQGSSGSSGMDLSPVVSTLDKQLTIQTQMLEVLKQILQSTDPAATVKAMKEAITGEAKPAAPAGPSGAPPAMKQPTAPVDLRRKIA